MTYREMILLLDRAVTPRYFITKFFTWFFSFDWIRSGSKEVSVTAQEDGAEVSVDFTEVNNRLNALELGKDEKVKTDSSDPTTGYLDAKVQNSIENDAINHAIQLVGDNASPGNTKLYGTNGSGTKGWYDQPADAFTVKADAGDALPDYLDSKCHWSIVVDGVNDVLELLGDADPAGAGGAGWLYYGNDSLGNRGFHQLGPVRVDSADSVPDFLENKVEDSIAVNHTTDKLHLLGDDTHPVGAWKYYGEDNAGNRGFHQLGPVRADSADSAPGFLEEKCENSIEVDQGTDKLHLVGDDGGVSPWSLYGCDAVGGNDHKGWQSTTEITVITAIRNNGGTIEYKTRTIQALNPGTESDWTAT